MQMGTYKGAAVIKLPTHPAPKSIELAMNDTNAMSRSPFTGSTQVQAWPGADWWDAQIALPQMNASDAAVWSAYLAECRGILNVFVLSDPTYTGPKGTVKGAPVVSGVNNAMATTLTTRGWTPNSFGLLKPGDYFQLGSVASGLGLTGSWWRTTGNSGANPYPSGGGVMSTAPLFTTSDTSVNYEMNAGAGNSTYNFANAVTPPTPSDGLGYTDLYVVWTGYFQAPSTGTYTIGVNSDDGATLYVNGTKLVNNLAAGQGADGDLVYTESGTIALTAGETYSITLDYQNTSGSGAIQLLWTPPGATSPSLLTVGTGYQFPARLYRVLDVVNSDANGNATITIWPSLREATVDGQAITFSKPAGLFRLADNRRSVLTDETRLSGISLKAIEAR